MTDTIAPAVPGLIFQDPPVSVVGRCGGYQTEFSLTMAAWLSQLRRFPGQWCKYPKVVNSGVASSIKSGSYGARRGEFDTTTRVAVGPKNSVDMYVRYIAPA